MITTGTAYAATTPGAQTAPTTGVTNPAAQRPAKIAAKSRGRHLLGVKPVRVRGTLAPVPKAGKVSLQVRTRRGGWRSVDRARTRAGGRFRLAWRPRSVGSYRLRVRFAGDPATAGAARVLPRVHVYRPGAASWYGPGLYGNGMACGGTLTASVVGVAHRSLRCGTRVRLRYRGRSVVARVVDRGPYTAGREWDLTAGTKRRLGFGSTGTVWSNK
jgi:hypothetical protein